MSIDVFYRELSPYGTWIQNNEYGFVWVPHHHDNFYPYSSGGYWLFTEYGWTWVSSYSWGWAPFHYGRWFYDSFYGWVWVPGYNWGAAWVTWRYCPGYYGWAPLGPDIGYDFAFSNGYYLPHEQWHFIHQHDLGRRDVDKRILGMGGYIKYLNDSKVIDNVKHDEHQQISYHAGPARNEVERITGKKINALAIENATTPVQLVRKSSLKIYRPELQSEKLQPAAIAPKKFENWKGAANPKKADEIEEHHPVKQLPEKEIRQPVKPVPERITPKQEQQVPEKEKPVIQPRQQEVPRQEIQHPEAKPIPQKETRPIIEAPTKSKPIEQRPSRQRINEIPKNNNQTPVKKMTPQERPVLKQSIPIKRRP